MNDSWNIKVTECNPEFMADYIMCIERLPLIRNCGIIDR